MAEHSVHTRDQKSCCGRPSCCCDCLPPVDQDYLLDAAMIALGHDHSSHKTKADAEKCHVLWDAEAVVEALDPIISRRERTAIAADLREQAAEANFAVRGKHPKIAIETHAAALRWAAARVEQ